MYIYVQVVASVMESNVHLSDTIPDWDRSLPGGPWPCRMKGRMGKGVTSALKASRGERREEKRGIGRHECPPSEVRADPDNPDNDLTGVQTPSFLGQKRRSADAFRSGKGGRTPLLDVGRFLYLRRPLEQAEFRSHSASRRLGSINLLRTTAKPQRLMGSHPLDVFCHDRRPQGATLDSLSLGGEPRGATSAPHGNAPQSTLCQSHRYPHSLTGKLPDAPISTGAARH